MQRKVQRMKGIVAHLAVVVAEIKKNNKMEIRTMLASDWEAVKQIYEEGIATGNATFQTSAPNWKEWDETHVQSCRLIALDDEEVVLGWAALTAVSGRCVYAGVGEVSVYVAANARGKGVGKKLLHALIEESERNNFWTLQAGIFPENKSSVRIHEELGFRQVGFREKIGEMNGVWRDTLFFEKRSKVVGMKKVKLLFVCIENSNRSQMAQAFALMQPNVEAYSAGSKPSGIVNPKAIAAMKELDYDLSVHASKSLQEVEAYAPYDAVVTMGCGDACPWIVAKQNLDWQIPDPKHMERNEFNAVRDLIANKVWGLVEEIKEKR
jgi:L-amino acid N-acyltransferase YncA/protein-tyrosine-phosphatase